VPDRPQIVQPLDVQIARAVTPDQSVVCYAARDGLIKIGTTDRLSGRVHQLKAELPGFEPGSFDPGRARKHQFAALRTASRCEWFYPGTVLREHIRQLPAHLHTRIRCRADPSSRRPWRPAFADLTG
jgi:hypothetical protein